MAAVAVLDAHQYAEKLRNSLMQDIFDGNQLEVENEQEQPDSYAFVDRDDAGSSLQHLLDQELEEFQSHDVIKGILDHGRLLKEYARDVDDKLRQVELESIQDYIQESDNLVALHEQVKDCDDILSHMEQLLGRFQGDLGKVSEEIRQLQVQSQTMSMKLRNRRAAEQKLGDFVEQLALPEDLVIGILDSEVSEDYLEYLLALDRKLKYLSADDTARASQARRDVEPALEKLRIKAVSKVRDFLLQKIYTLKRPKTNIQIIQQNSLLKYKYFVRFLVQHGKDVYTEIRDEYVAVLSKILSQHFRTYLASMEKMQVAVSLPTDLLGAPAASTGVNVMALFGKAAAKGALTEDAFALNDRASILHQLEQSAIIPHMAEFEGKRFPYEVVFRNVHKLLMDTATSEYYFCLDFFEDENVFRDLFAPIISVIESDLIASAQELADMIALMLMIRINHEHRRIMLKRRVPCLDDYLDRVHLLLWPKLKMNFDAQLASVKVGNERALFVNDVAVHFVVKRYAALTSSMLVLMAEQEQEGQGIFKAQGMHDMMERLWGAIFDMLLRMSNMFKDRRQGIIFLIVNYSHILSVLRHADAAATSATCSSPTASPSGGLGKSGATAIKECEDQLANCTSLYVEDQLHQHYRDLVDYVKKAEQTQKRLAVPDGAHLPGYAPAQAQVILQDFAARWMASIEAMHREVLKHFADAACGRDVLQASMTQLLLYYTRMLELLKRQGPDGVRLTKEAVNIPSIMYEIKRITKT